ncbi:aldehyde dehydrogenase family protein [Pseudomonas vanderleydeniana]|uniref:Aldehyde dehydrogenase family protein n=1 Tax=Pseudomonas vanderleydeniana TaxID=2745495 RepID=A0A9E6TQW8_9PSED|nr:aldehyde dehydrogenase family protein [Pseudomonas vanderleydeniana]QXI26385.1 aldehyde dehydrogenase family protein [Pseudomonas vanderleydeniana]
MHKNLIAGQWYAGCGVRENINPSDIHDTVGLYAQASRDDTLMAICAAQRAQPQWAARTPQQRADALDFIGNQLLLQRESLGHLLAREEGKVLAEGIGEVTRAGQIFKFFAAEALRIRGEHLASLRPGIEVDIRRHPVGVVGIITPWNFPIAIPAWKIAPALAYGNSVVFKPADLVPGSAWALADIINRAGLPDGTFNLLMGRGSVVGQTMAEAAQVNAISFTGSVETGRVLMQTAGARFAKLQLEMGGKNPLIIMADANLDQAVECAVQGAYYSTGQRCTASSRLIVDKAIYPTFTAALIERLKHLRVGHALHADSQIGPVADAAQLEQNLDYIAIGRHEGARLAHGGERLERETTGHFMSPALFVDASAEMRIAREEIFGPVACAIPADHYEHALALANDSPFGLSAGICTTSLKHATHFKQHMQSGMVMVNTPTAGVDYHVPFGGCKGSSHGSREQGSYAAEFFTTVKTAYTQA